MFPQAQRDTGHNFPLVRCPAYYVWYRTICTEYLPRFSCDTVKKPQSSFTSFVPWDVEVQWTFFKCGLYNDTGWLGAVLRRFTYSEVWISLIRQNCSETNSKFLASLHIFWIIHRFESYISPASLSNVSTCASKIIEYLKTLKYITLFFPNSTEQSAGTK